MNRLLNRILPATVLSAVLLASAASWAKGGHEGYSPERMLAHMSAALELTDTQKEEIGELLKSGEAQAKADRERMNEVRDSLDAQRKDFNAGEAQKLADELGEITSRMSYEKASRGAEVYTLLNEEQRVKMEEMRAQRDERREKMKGSKQKK